MSDAYNDRLGEMLSQALEDPYVSLDDSGWDWIQGAEWGAGWAFALVGMGQSIQDGLREGRFSAEYWEYVGDDTWEQWRDGRVVRTERSARE